DLNHFVRGAADDDVKRCLAYFRDGGIFVEPMAEDRGPIARDLHLLERHFRFVSRGLEFFVENVLDGLAQHAPGDGKSKEPPFQVVVDLYGPAGKLRSFSGGRGCRCLSFDLQSAVKLIEVRLIEMNSCPGFRSSLCAATETGFSPETEG